MNHDYVGREEQTCSMENYRLKGGEGGGMENTAKILSEVSELAPAS